LFDLLGPILGDAFLLDHFVQGFGTLQDQILIRKTNINPLINWIQFLKVEKNSLIFSSFAPRKLLCCCCCLKEDERRFIMTLVK
jgi:hypothetical protein